MGERSDATQIQVPLQPAAVCHTIGPPIMC